MKISDNEKKMLVLLVKHEIETFKKDGKTALFEITPNLLAIEDSYDIFLEKLLKKLD